MIMKGWMTFALLLVALPVSAQTVVAPTGGSFVHAAADFDMTASYRLEFFQCGSLVAGVCTGRAASPFQSSTFPKSILTGTSPRSFQFSAFPAGSPLPSLPIGTPFVSTVLAIGDPANGGVGESARSGDSNPFFAQGRTPAPPTSLVHK